MIVTWLDKTINNLCDTILSAIECKDEVRDWYAMEILNTPSRCDSCSTKLPTTHKIGCKKGNLIHSLHDENRESFNCFACAGFQLSNICHEPQINPFRAIEGNDDSSDKYIEIQSGVQCDTNVVRGGLFIRDLEIETLNASSIRPTIKLVNYINR